MKISEHSILEAALPVFKARGIRAAHVSDIAQACGIRLKELKSQFHSKKSLVSAFVDYLLIRHTAYLQVNPLLSPTAITELQNFFQFVERLASDLTPTILLELRKYSNSSWSRLNEYKDRTLAPYLQQNLKRGISEGFYRDDIESELFVVLYFNLLYVIVTELNNPFGEGRKLLPHFHKIFLRGLLSTRGVRM